MIRSPAVCNIAGYARPVFSSRHCARKPAPLLLSKHKDARTVACGQFRNKGPANCAVPFVLFTVFQEKDKHDAYERFSKVVQ